MLGFLLIFQEQGIGSSGKWSDIVGLFITIPLALLIYLLILLLLGFPELQRIRNLIVRKNK